LDGFYPNIDGFSSLDGYSPLDELSNDLMSTNSVGCCYQTSNTSEKPCVGETPCQCKCHNGYLEVEELFIEILELSTDQNLQQKARNWIKEGSLKFDNLTKVEVGFYKKADCLSRRLLKSDGTQYLIMPPADPHSIRLFLNDSEIHSTSFKQTPIGLVWQPCCEHLQFSCPSGCMRPRLRVTRPFPRGCYEVCAKFGYECEQADVKGAVADYVLWKYYTMKIGQNNIGAAGEGSQYKSAAKAYHDAFREMVDIRSRQQRFIGVA
jgi:hypothetical protein